MGKIGKAIGGVALAGALFTGCSSSNNSSDNNVKLNSAPEFKGLPTSLVSLKERTNKILSGIECIDLNGDNVIVSLDTSDSNLGVFYNKDIKELDLNATTINLADGVNKYINVTLTCSDGDLNTTKNMEVVVQDEINDKYMTYTTNIANSVETNATLNGTIILNDPDGQLDNSYSFDLVDENNNIVYSGVIEDNNNDGNYNFSIDFSNLSLQAGNYTFKTEEIYPVDGGENYQGPVVIEQNITLEAPSTSWMTIPSDRSVDDPSGNTPELVLSSVVDYINNYNGTDVISVEGDSRFEIQNGDLVYVGGNITGADQTVTLQLKVGDVLSNSFTVTIKNKY